MPDNDVGADNRNVVRLPNDSSNFNCYDATKGFVEAVEECGKIFKHLFQWKSFGC